MHEAAEVWAVHFSGRSVNHNRSSMNTRPSFLALVLPMILLQMTSVTWGQAVSSDRRRKRHGDETGDQTVGLMGCGRTKGCFRQPMECMGDNCMAYVTWETLGDGQSRFSLRAQAAGWVAFGLRPEGSTDNGMVPADVYACTNKGELRRSKNGPGFDSFPNPLPQNALDAVTTESAEFSNGVIRCTFTRQPSLDGDDSFYNISGNNQYFILMAFGSSIRPDGDIQGNQHQNRWSTADTRSLQFDFSPPMSSGEALPKAHASLMVIAWVGFASIGITMARFFKPMWPNSKLCGTKVWFTIHRMCMVTCVLCFSAAFVLIFVHRQGFVDTGERTIVVAHAICGIIVTCLGIINPIMAIFRPHPGTPNRPIFNWAHWGVGTTAHLLGLVTVFLGIGYNSTGLLRGIPDYVFFVMIVFIGFHILIWILFEVQRCMTESQGRSNDVALKATGDSTDHLSPDVDSDPPSGSTAKTILLCIYVVGVIIAVAFLVISIAIAG
ncbi:putative ferric-chelate reductase 1 isoform X2 [Patiria miniata]|uniref:Ferric-chelate reductase 1 n=1 Tax=Patiria miniata TaxID=46514 RepID=A0A914AZF9_PATMI|nr:putative ferric-chelate reductase 1 isoform X2 [Patiria miniata]